MDSLYITTFLRRAAPYRRLGGRRRCSLPAVGDRRGRTSSGKTGSEAESGCHHDGMPMLWCYGERCYRITVAPCLVSGPVYDPQTDDSRLPAAVAASTQVQLHDKIHRGITCPRKLAK